MGGYEYMYKSALKKEIYDIDRPDTRKIEALLQSGKLENCGEMLDVILDEVNFREVRSMMLRLYIVMDMYMLARSFARDLGITSEQFSVHFGVADDIESKMNNVDDTILFIKEMFAQCIRWRIETAKENSNCSVKNAKEYIDRNYMDYDISLCSVAEAVGLTPTYLSALFKKGMGQNMSEYLTSVRIDRSKKLLCCTSKLICEIAYEVGFRDYRYFSQIFKKRTGQTPRQFQNSANICP